MATTVIIPALNEEKTIGDIVKTFMAHAETADVYVGLDSWTTDGTAQAVWDAGGIAVHTGAHGKGQVIAAMRTFPLKVAPRMIMCDADYTGLIHRHIDQILTPRRGLVIGVPDFPEQEVPPHVIDAWPHISGFRAMPWWLFPDEDANGYFVDTQINLRAIRNRLGIKFAFMEGLKSPFTWPLPPGRLEIIKREREWGTTHGYL